MSSGSNSVTLDDTSIASSSFPLFERISHPGLNTFSPHTSPLLHRITGPLFLFVEEALIFPTKGTVAPIAVNFLINFLL